MTDPIPLPAPDIKALAQAALPDGISPFVVSRIRTAVPLVAGVALAWGEHEIARRTGWLPTVDSATVASGATFVASYAYYEIVRRLERLKPSLGWLLGYPAQPVY